MKLKRVAVIGGMLDRRDPSGILAITIANDLAKSGCEVSLLVKSAENPDIADGVKVRCLGSNARLACLREVLFRRALHQSLVDSEPEYTISTLSTVAADFLVPATGTVIGSRRAALRASAGWFERVKARLNQYKPAALLSLWLEYRARTGGKLKAWVALGSTMRNELLAECRTPLAPVLLAASPGDDLQEDPAHLILPDLRQEMSRALGLDAQSFWVMHCFDEPGQGGLEAMLCAFKPFIELGADAFLLIAGSTRYTHLAWIGELGLRSRVRLIGCTEHRAACMAACDLVCWPTRYDPVGWGALPALASGTPVVTTSACGLAYAVRQRAGAVIDAPVQPSALLRELRTGYDRWQHGELSQSRMHAHHEPNPRASEVIRGLIQSGAGPLDDPRGAEEPVR